MSKIKKRPLGDIAKFLPGLRTRKFTPKSKGKPVPVIGSEALTESGIDRSRMALVESFGPVAEKHRTQTGDLLLPAKSPDLHRASLVTPEFAGEVFNASVLAIRLTDKIDPCVLRLWLSSPNAKPNWLTPESLGELPVPVPSPARQREVIALLEAADEAYEAEIEAAETRRGIAGQTAVEQMTADA